MKHNVLQLLIIILCEIYLSTCIDIWLKKGNIFIQNNTYYKYKLTLTQSQQQLIPFTVNFTHQVENSLATTNQYFDYFMYLSKNDQNCYQQAIGNASYLFPCPFLINNSSKLRVSFVNQSSEENKYAIQQISELHYDYIVDNTPFPFPEGAISFDNVTVSLSTWMHIELNDTYEKMGVRLIYINITILLIYFFALGVLIWRNRKTEQKMQTEKQLDIQLRISHDRKSIKDEQSDIDNYEVIVQNQFSVRDSRQIPSLITSGNQDFIRSRKQL